MREPSVLIIRDDGLGELNPRLPLDGRPWRLVRDGLAGFDGIEHDVSTQDYAQVDGARILSHRTGPKDRSISFAALGDPERLRAQMRRFFTAGSTFEVHIDTGSTRCYTRGVQYAVTIPADNRTNAQLVTWTILSPEPMLLSEDEKGFDLARATGVFGFPFTSFEGRVAPSPVKLPRSSRAAQGKVVHNKGFVVGLLSKKIVMVNDGQSTAYPRFVIRATGPVVKPRIEIADKAGNMVCTFGVNASLKRGDVLVVDFSARPTVIELNGNNVSNLAMAGSTLATGIGVGEFTVSWSAESGDAALSIRPSIRERYTSI